MRDHPENTAKGNCVGRIVGYHSFDALKMFLFSLQGASPTMTAAVTHHLLIIQPGSIMLYFSISHVNRAERILRYLSWFNPLVACYCRAVDTDSSSLGNVAKGAVTHPVEEIESLLYDSAGTAEHARPTVYLQRRLLGYASLSSIIITILNTS